MVLFIYIHIFHYLTDKGNRIMKKKKFSDTKVYKFFYPVRYALLAAGCTGVLMAIVYFAFELLPFGSMTILRMDLYHQYGPLFAELFERVKNFDSLLYSWTSGGGGAFLGNFFNYLSSPFAVVMLLLGHKNMPEAIALMVFLKACTASFTFSYFIQKKFKTESPLTSAFGVLYSCCGYFIAYYWNIMWLDAFYLFPLVILGIEKLISERKMKLYIVTLALTFVTNYYMAYMVCIFSVIYFIYYYFSNYAVTEKYVEGKIKKEPKGFYGLFMNGFNFFRNSRFFDSGIRFAFCSVGAAALAAFSLFPVFFVLRSCSATSGTFPSEFKTYFSIFDFLANHLAYLDPTIRSSGTDVLPNVYCGVLTVMLVPLFIFSNRVSAKEKVFSVGILGFMFASCYTNYLNYIWHGFHFPNDLPYRFSFMYSFLLLVFAFKALTFIEEYTHRQLIAAGTATVFFVIIVQEIGSKNFSETGVWICIAFIIVYCAALGILKNDRYPRIAAAVLILCSVCAEYLVSNTNHYSMDQPKTSFVGDYDNFTEVKELVDEDADGRFYRMELTQLRARMDPCWYYYNGMSTFSSMAYEKSANMQSHLGMFSNFINSYTYNRQTPVYNAFFGLDYIVDNMTGDKAEMNPKYYSEIGSVDKFTAYKNNFTLPLAFCADEAVEQWSHDNSNPFEVQSELFWNATGLNNVYTDMELDRINAVGITSDYEAFGDSGCYPFTLTGSNADASMTYELKAMKDGNAYLYYKTGASNVERITITLNNGTAFSQPIDTKPYIYDLGYLKKGETVSVFAPIKEGDSGYTYLYAVTLDDEVFEKGYEKLKAGALNVTDFKETHFSGTLNAPKNSVLFTSINYDKGWSVYIDGKKVSDEDIFAVGEALLGVRITEGKHTVTFDYTPEGLVLGCIISAVALITMLGMALLIKKHIFDFEPELESEKCDEEAADGEHDENNTDSANSTETLTDGTTVEEVPALRISTAALSDINTDAAALTEEAPADEKAAEETEE